MTDLRERIEAAVTEGLYAWAEGAIYASMLTPEVVTELMPLVTTELAKAWDEGFDVGDNPLALSTANPYRQEGA